MQALHCISSFFLEKKEAGLKTGQTGFTSSLTQTDLKDREDTGDSLFVHLPQNEEVT